MKIYVGHMANGGLDQFKSKEKPTREFVEANYAFVTGPFDHDEEARIFCKSYRGEELTAKEHIRKLEWLMGEWKKHFDGAKPGSIASDVKAFCEKLKREKVS